MVEVDNVEIKSAKRTVFKAAGIVSLAIIIGYPLGYIRDMLLMKGFGAGSETDAWMIASQVPDLVFKFLLFGALGASFIPVFIEFLMRKKEEEAWEVACTVMNFVVLVLSLIAVLGIVGAPLLISVFSPGFSPETKVLAIKLTRVVLPLVIIVGITGLITGIYHAYLKFRLPAFTNLLTPLVVILFIIFLSKRVGIFSLAYGSVAGASLSLFMLILFFFRRKVPYKFKINFRHPAIKKILILMIPLIGGDLIGKSIGVIWRIFASFLEEGSITALTLAGKLVAIPVVIFAGAASTAIFPLLSRQKAQENISELKDTLIFGIRMMFMILLPAMVGFMVIGKPIIRLLFEHGLFNANDTQNTAAVLFFSSIGLLAYGIDPILCKACYALKKNWYFFKYELIGFILTFPTLYIFLKIMGLAGIALGGALVRIVVVLYLGRMLSRELGGFNLRSLSKTFYKVTLSSLLMGGFCYTLFAMLNNILTPAILTNQIIRVGSCIIAGAAFYFVFLSLFKVEEINKLWQMVKRNINEKNITSSSDN